MHHPKSRYSFTQFCIDAVLYLIACLILYTAVDSLRDFYATRDFGWLGWAIWEGFLSYVFFVLFLESDMF